ncbi:galacturonic acid acetyl transferase [Streptococcus pseudoporcinus]|uniref:Galacturonic acid acetyl transferase n=1 Tax=Streptococcus pseudoporcinus TaxID=361101 RepID=A0A4U9YL54_9STRE|nr:acyltransferase [Streptococcus pseudoporcinus]VTS27299.1 galacturonic acid acetyl transferase [Streptococcus pseudoporcinus]
MNKYFRAIIDFPTALIKTSFFKIYRFKSFKSSILSFMSPYSELTVDRGAKVIIGKNFRQRSQSRIRVRNGGELRVGKNISLNHGCMIVSREKIVIGDDVQFGPNVFLYDHDHDYKTEGGISSGKYKTSPIIIEKDVWLGAGTIVLRGTKIGAGSVVAAGSVIKGCFPRNSLIYQPKETNVRVHNINSV